MFLIENGREHFYQWDLNQRLIITDETVTEVHFCNRTDSCSLVCEVYTEDGVRLVNVPNVLLMNAWLINAYAYCNGCYTKESAVFKVKARTKPADYAYTETEVRTWNELTKEINKKLNTSTYNTDKTKVNNNLDSLNYASDAISNNARHNAYLLSIIQEQLGLKPTERVLENVGNTITIPVGAKPYARIDKLCGMCSSYDTNGGNGYASAAINFPKRIINDKGKVLFEMPSNIIDGLGVGQGRYSNYVLFDNGRAYFHQSCKLTDYSYTLDSNETELATFYDSQKLIALANPVITDISDVVLSDGYIDITGATSLTVEMRYTEEDVRKKMDGESYSYVMPKAVIAFEVSGGVINVLFE